MENTQAETVGHPHTHPDHPTVDVRDMLVVHTALLREFRLAPAAVSRVASRDLAQARKVDAHFTLLCDLLHHHHAGEDALLWPPLRTRLPAQALALLADAENQHQDVNQALQHVNSARSSWVGRAYTENRAELVQALHTFHDRLAEHLDYEERTLLPLAAAHLTEAEWRAIGEAGAAGVPKSKMPLVFGMFAYEGDPEVLAEMLKTAPALPRLIVPRIAPHSYARRAAQVHGTPRP